MGQPAPIPRRSSHLGSAACYGRSDHGSHSSTSAASSRSKRRQGNHNRFQTLKMFPDGHLGVLSMVVIGADARAQHVPDGFMDAAEVVLGLVVDIRYAGEHNFVGRPIDGYEAPRCLLTRPAAQALAAVQNDLATSRLGLKVFDCYRPARAVAHFVRWARDPNDIGRKLEFYPGIEKRDLFRLGYMSHRSRHSRGSTVDLTLVDRRSGREVDMGTDFDLFGPKS